MRNQWFAKNPSVLPYLVLVPLDVGVEAGRSSLHNATRQSHRIAFLRLFQLRLRVGCGRSIQSQVCLLLVNADINIISR